MQFMTSSEIENSRVEGMLVQGSHSSSKHMGMMYGKVEFLGKVDVFKYLVRPSDCNKYLIYFNKSRICLTHISGEIIGASVSFLYCNPETYSRGRRSSGRYLGRPNHYLQAIIYIDYKNSNGDVKTETKYIIDGIFKSRKEVDDYIQVYWNRVTGENIYDTNKEINLTVFSTILAESKKNKYNSVSDAKLFYELSYFEGATKNSLAALEKAEFIQKKEVSYTRDGVTTSFTTYSPTQKGIDRLSKIME